jgi:N-acetylglucosamine-6-sulfatase
MGASELTFGAVGLRLACAIVGGPLGACCLARIRCLASPGRAEGGALGAFFGLMFMLGAGHLDQAAASPLPLAVAALGLLLYSAALIGLGRTRLGRPAEPADRRGSLDAAGEGSRRTPTWLTRRTMAAPLAAVGIAAAVVMASSDRRDGVSSTPAEPAAEQGAPNVVVVMTDDQALDTMRAMPRTRRLIAEKGVRFDNAVVSFPLCCPSRASFLTGQYAHNHRVLDNHPPKGGYGRLDAEHTLPAWLSRAGYRTGFVGKFLNGYGEEGKADEIPPGWSDWYGLPSKAKRRPFDFPLNENGKLVEYGDRDHEYKTEVLTEKAVSFIGDRARSRRPFFLYVSTTAPHADYGLSEDADRNPEPAPRDRGMFEGHAPPKRESVNEKDVSDKPRFIQSRSRLGSTQREAIEKVYVSQLESLVAVDRLVGRVVAELRHRGELDNSVVMFTSDNGFLRGQHRLDSGKANPYEEAIRVPLLVRGPGFPEGVRDDRLVANVDLAPTILDIAGADADRPVDGRSLFPFEGDDNRSRAVLLEVYERSHGRFVGVRTDRYVYAEYDGRGRELYDLERDPQQLESLHDDPHYADVRAWLAGLLNRLHECAGQDCR